MPDLNASGFKTKSPTISPTKDTNLEETNQDEKNMTRRNSLRVKYKGLGILFGLR